MRFMRTSSLAPTKTRLKRRSPPADNSRFQIMSQRSFRRIATEEAFATPEQVEALRALVASSREYDPDTFLANMQTDGDVISRRLLDVGEERLSIMDASGVSMAVLAMTSTGVQQFAVDTA